MTERGNQMELISLILKGAKNVADLISPYIDNITFKAENELMTVPVPEGYDCDSSPTSQAPSGRVFVKINLFVNPNPEKERNTSCGYWFKEYIRKIQENIECGKIESFESFHISVEPGIPILITLIYKYK